MSSTSLEQDKKQNQETCIFLKVKSEDGREIFYKLKPSTKFSKLMNDYCNRHSIPINSIAFLFNGRRLCDEETPEEFKMKDEDKIDALIDMEDQDEIDALIHQISA